MILKSTYIDIIYNYRFVVKDMNKRNRPIKLEDLAKKLKVSKVTISKALAGSS